MERTSYPTSIVFEQESTKTQRENDSQQLSFAAHALRAQQGLALRPRAVLNWTSKQASRSPRYFSPVRNSPIRRVPSSIVSLVTG
jgi:hypothetical protein